MTYIQCIICGGTVKGYYGGLHPNSGWCLCTDKVTGRKQGNPRANTYVHDYDNDMTSKYSPNPHRGIPKLPARTIPKYPDILLDIQYVHEPFKEGGRPSNPTVYLYAYTTYRGTFYSEKWTKGPHEDKSVGELCVEIMSMIHKNIALTFKK